MASPKKAKSKKQIVDPTTDPIDAPPVQVENRADKIRQIDGLIVQIVGTAATAALYGAIMCSLCYTILHFGASTFGSLLYKLFHDINLGFAQLILPQAFLPYATWIALGIPATLLTYHVIYAVLTGTHGINSSKNSNFLQTALMASFVALPFVGFGIGLLFGLSVTPLMWVTWGLGALTGVYLSEIGQAIAQGFFPQPEQEEEQSGYTADEEDDLVADQVPAPNADAAPPVLHHFANKKKSAAKRADKVAIPTKKKAPARRAHH